MSGPTFTSQMKNSPETMQTSTGSFPSQSNGRKRECSDQGSEPVKRERLSRSDDGDVGHLKADSVLKYEIAKITERGGLFNFEGVERLIQLMQPENTEKKLDWPSRSLLAGVIAATDRFDCLSKFVQLRGLVVLDEWLQEIHKSKIGDSSGPKDSDRSFEEFLLVLLRALDKLPVNLNALQTCNIGKSVNHLRSNRNSEIQKKARSLVDTWKKRVEAEMNITDARSGADQAVPWNARPRSEVSHGDNRQTGGASDVVLRSSVTQISSSKSASIKLVQPESNGKPSAASPAPSKTSLPASPTAVFRDGQPRTSVTGGNPEIPQAAARDDRSSSSSQSHTNSQCSSEHGKNFAPSGKEDARSSTAGSTSASKVTGSASRHRRSPNGLHGASASAGQREGVSSINSTKISAQEKSSAAPLTSEKTNDTPAAEGNNHKLIVKIPNQGRSPAQSVVGGSIDDPTCTSSRASSPMHSEKNEHLGQAVKDNVDAFRTAITSEINTESWQSNDLRDAVSDEGDGSPAVAPDSDRRQTADDSAKREDIKPRKSLQPSFSPMNALMESCAKYSGAGGNALTIDDVGMNLLASVAAGESGIATPSGSPPNLAEEPCTDHSGTAQVNEDDPSSQSSTSGKDFTPNEESCLKSNGKANDSIGPSSEPTTGGEELKGRKTSKEPGFLQSIFLGSLPAFFVPSTSVALPASVTVAAAAKGPFFPSEVLIKNKGELRWKGSAATSAFRPAEPWKASEPARGTGGVPLCNAPSSKPARTPLEFDLNVADDMVLEDMGCQVPTPGKSDAKRSSSFIISGQAGTASLPRSGGLDLDLNTMDEAPELGLLSNIHRYEALLQPAWLASSSGFTHSNASSRRNFDLNGPGVDESVAEPSLNNQARANFPMQLPLRINNADMVSLSSWYPPGNSYSAVLVPSLMTDRGDQPFPVVRATGIPQRISNGPTGNTFDMDAY